MTSPFWETDPRYPPAELGAPGVQNFPPGSSPSAGPVFWDGPSETANNISTDVLALAQGATATTDIWQELWQTGVDELTVASGIQGDNSTRLSSTFVLICEKGGIFEGIGGVPPQPNIGF